MYSEHVEPLARPRGCNHCDLVEVPGSSVASVRGVDNVCV